MFNLLARLRAVFVKPAPPTPLPPLAPGPRVWMQLHRAKKKAPVSRK